MTETRKRGEPASFDRETGEVRGSGSGAGVGAPGEDYDDDPMAGGGSEPTGAQRPNAPAERDRETRSDGATSGKGHPLPASAEARHGEIPEHLEREKGRGDDPAGLTQPGEEAVSPEGEAYRYGDLGRGSSAPGRTDKGA
ncbi:hypothetical protein [Sphingosinicella sp. CPCC 101087]|uniref:hypothetical protein n=1 Tax=Sphingosinicella sp. CPCC 101087 TaxID=2497754 RepID=UPI00101D4AF3|nr:hypothetical protein [Sphingosinicella sp. CPCC 101087]